MTKKITTMIVSPTLAEAKVGQDADKIRVRNIRKLRDKKVFIET